MGKSLKRKECGKGIRQRKDGLYSARYYTKDGERREKYFKSLPEAKNWLADTKYELRHRVITCNSDMSVDNWFDYWITNIICNRSPNCIRNYTERYKRNVQPLIGTMCMGDVKPMHCQIILNRMESTYAGSTIRQTYIAMGTMFKSAVMNDIIVKHPMNGVRYNKPVRAVDDIRYLSVEEQKRFLAVAKDSHNYRQYALLLETGLRTGELIGLTWDAINWKKRTLTVNKSLEYRHHFKYWRAGPPKTVKSYRTIPLTDTAYRILKSCYDERLTRKESPTLQQILEYTDRRTGRQMYFCMHDLVFVNYRTGEPIKNSSYDTHSISCAKKPALLPLGCMRCAIRMLPARLSAACSPRSCSSCWGTPVSRRRWTNTSMFLMIQCRTPCVFLRQLIVRKRGKPRKWG